MSLFSYYLASRYNYYTLKCSIYFRVHAGFPRNFNASSASVIIVAVVIITCVVLMIALAIVITFVAVRKNKTRSSRQPNANM